MESSSFGSVDPAPPLKGNASASTEELTVQLLDENRSLFDRYRAMFTLRNMRSDKGVLALTKGMHIFVGLKLLFNVSHEITMGSFMLSGALIHIE